MMFIYENICKESSIDKLAALFDDSYKIVDFDSKIPHEGIFVGSIAGCRWLKENRPKVKVWCSPKNYLCSKYYPHCGDLLFNEPYAFYPFKEVARLKYKIWADFGKEAVIFLRPDCGEKPFTGGLTDIDDIDKLVESIDYEGLAVASSPKNVLGEWRIVVSRQDIIAETCYRYQEQLVSIPSAPTGTAELTKEFLNRNYFPDEIFCVDICQSFHIMELTSFSSAGLYGCDMKKIRELLKQFVA